MQSNLKVNAFTIVFFHLKANLKREFSIKRTEIAFTKIFMVVHILMNFRFYIYDVINSNKNKLVEPVAAQIT